MGEIKKQSIQSSVILGIGVVLGFFLKLYVFPAYLEPSEIGFFTVLIDISNLCASFIPLGSQLVFMRYLQRFIGNEGKSSSLRKLAYSTTAISFLVFIVMFLSSNQWLIDFYSDRAPLLSNNFLVIIPLVFARALHSLAAAYSKGRKKTVFPSFIQEILIRFLTLILVVLYGYAILDFDFLVAGYLGVYFVSSLLVFISIKKLSGWQINWSKTAFSKIELKDILIFGGFSLLTNTGTILIRSIDSIMLTSIKNLEAAGIYSIAFFIGFLVEIPRRAISQISFPFLAEAFNKKDFKTIEELYQKSALNQLIAGSFIFVCLVGSLNELFMIMPNGSIYATAASVVILIGLAKLIDTSSGSNSEILSNSEYFRYNFLSITILAPLGIATNLLLIPKLGLTGAAWASLITMFLVNAFRFFIIYWKLKMIPYSLNWLKTLALFIATLALSYYLPTFGNPYLSIIIKSLLLGGLILVGAFTLKVSTELDAVVDSLIKKIRG